VKILDLVGNHVIGLVELGNMKIIISENQLKKLIDGYNFNMGDCDIYAVALHRLYGYPLYTIRGYFLEPEWGGKREWDHEDCHIIVRLPNGKFKDSDGEYTLKELKPLASFAEDVKKIKAVKISEEEALSIFSIEDQEEDIKTVMDMISKKQS